MADISQLPTWAVYVVAFGTPASAFVAVMITGLLGRRSAAEMERRSRREEVMRLMRWSSELAMQSALAGAVKIIEEGADEIAQAQVREHAGDSQLDLQDAPASLPLIATTDEGAADDENGLRHPLAEDGGGSIGRAQRRHRSTRFADHSQDRQRKARERAGRGL